jgi:hypothetical protein
MHQERAETELERFKQDVAYYESHREELLEKHPEQWVAIFNRNVVAVAPELEALLHNLEKQGISSAHALVKHMTQREDVLISAYDT